MDKHILTTSFQENYRGSETYATREITHGIRKQVNLM